MWRGVAVGLSRRGPRDGSGSLDIFGKEREENEDENGQRDY